MVWSGVGRGATVRSFRQHGAHIEDAQPFLQEKCQLFWQGENVQAVHAGLKVEPIEANDVNTMIHDHDVVLQNKYAGLLTVVGHIAIDFPTWFKGDGETKELLQLGEWLPLPERGAICIDTGCGKGGRLTAMVIEGDRYRLESV
jgi:serine/threonine protein phosphatase 1